MIIKPGTAVVTEVEKYVNGAIEIIGNINSSRELPNFPSKTAKSIKIGKYRHFLSNSISRLNMTSSIVNIIAVSKLGIPVNV